MKQTRRLRNEVPNSRCVPTPTIHHYVDTKIRHNRPNTAKFNPHSTSIRHFRTSHNLVPKYLRPHKTKTQKANPPRVPSPSSTRLPTYQWIRHLWNRFFIPYASSNERNYDVIAGTGTTSLVAGATEPVHVESSNSLVILSPNTKVLQSVSRRVCARVRFLCRRRFFHCHAIKKRHSCVWRRLVQIQHNGYHALPSACIIRATPLHEQCLNAHHAFELTRWRVPYGVYQHARQHQELPQQGRARKHDRRQLHSIDTVVTHAASGYSGA